MSDVTATPAAGAHQNSGARAVARVYAEGFVGALSLDEAPQALEEFESFVTDVLGTQPEFVQMLASGFIRENQKIALLDRALAGRASERFSSFLRVLARHGRLDLLREILAESQLVLEARQGKQRVLVTSARPLSSSTVQMIHERLAQRLPFQPIVETNVDPRLLGGLRIRVGDTVYDSSLRSRLEQLRDRLRQRSVHEIQSGRNRFSNPVGN